MAPLGRSGRGALLTGLARKVEIARRALAVNLPVLRSLPLRLAVRALDRTLPTRALAWANIAWTLARTFTARTLAGPGSARSLTAGALVTWTLTRPFTARTLAGPGIARSLTARTLAGPGSARSFTARTRARSR